MKSILRELSEIPHTAKDLRKFGWTLGIAFGVLGGIFLWRGKFYGSSVFGVGILFLLTAWIYPKALRPVQKVWMGMALMIGWVMTRVILFVVFFLVVTPIGIILKIRGKDLLDIRSKDLTKSAWMDRETRPKSDYEKQY